MSDPLPFLSRLDDMPWLQWTLIIIACLFLCYGLLKMAVLCFGAPPPQVEVAGTRQLQGGQGRQGMSLSAQDSLHITLEMPARQPTSACQSTTRAFGVNTSPQPTTEKGMEEEEDYSEDFHSESGSESSESSSESEDKVHVGMDGYATSVAATSVAATSVAAAHGTAHGTSHSVLERRLRDFGEAEGKSEASPSCDVSTEVFIEVSSEPSSCDVSEITVDVPTECEMRWAYLSSRLLTREALSLFRAPRMTIDVDVKGPTAEAPSVESLPADDDLVPLDVWLDSPNTGADKRRRLPSPSTLDEWCIWLNIPARGFGRVDRVLEDVMRIHFQEDALKQWFSRQVETRLFRFKDKTHVGTCLSCICTATYIVVLHDIDHVFQVNGRVMRSRCLDGERYTVQEGVGDTVDFILQWTIGDGEMRLFHQEDEETGGLTV